MSKKTSKQAAVAIGAAMAGSMLLTGQVMADSNPFAMTELNSGYMQLAGHHEGKCGSGKCGSGSCGSAKGTEGKCGSGSCGSAKGSEGKCGSGSCGSSKGSEGKCGSGKCGSGSCGSAN